MTINAPSLLKEQLTRIPGLPLHQQLFLVIKEQIQRGLYASGTAIPNEAQLCELFDVSRITVRRAISDLERLGLVEKKWGKGTYVCEALPAQRPVATLGFLENLRYQAENTSVQVLRFEPKAQAPAVVALQLQLQPGDLAHHSVRLRSVGDQGVMVSEAWLPEAVAKGITKAKLQKKALYLCLMDNGIEFGRVVQEITATPAHPSYSQLLGTSAGAPLLRVTRLMYDKAQQPILHLTIHVSSERSRMLMDIDVGSINTLGAGQISHDAF